MRSRIVAILLASIIAFSIISAHDSSVRCKTHGFLTVRGTTIVGVDGQTVLLRGINYLGREGDIESNTEADYARFASMGFNVVRLPISWARLEPRPGVFDYSYLTYNVDRDVKWAKKHGMYIVLDMHQFKWAERFGGRGLPDWAVRDFPSTEAGMREAVSNFWIDGAVQYHFFKVWTEIARTYANEDTIAGYDLLNEPWVYTSVLPQLDAGYVDLLYSKTIKEIRKADPMHIIFLEPANLVSSGFAWDKNIVWSPHFYPLSFDPQYSHKDFARLEADLADKYGRYLVKLKTPMWIGEFGSFSSNKKTCDEWLKDAVTLFDKYNLGWAWWPPSERPAQIPDCLRVAETVERTTHVTVTREILLKPETMSRIYTFILGVAVGMAIMYLAYSVASKRKHR